MTAIDDAFRAFLASLVSTEPLAALASTNVSIHQLTRTMTDLVPIQMTGQGPLLLFAVTGGALFVFMFRT